MYWLQGYFKLQGAPGQLSEGQVDTIRRHLNLVFIHDIDPKAGGPEKQEELNAAHNPKVETKWKHDYPPGYRC